MPKKLPVRQGRAKTVPRRRPLFALFKLFVLLALLAASLAAYLFWAPVAQRASTIDVEIARGSSLREVARQLVAQGMDIEPGLLVLTARLSGQAKQIKAGNYRIEAGQSYRSLMQLLTSGAQRYSAFALV